MKKNTACTENNKLYHNTLVLLRSYRDAKWSLEVSMHNLETNFESEYFMTVKDFLDTVYAAGAELDGTEIESHAKSIERTRKMLELIANAAELIKEKHPRGEEMFRILYLSYLSPSPMTVLEQIAELEKSRIFYSERTFYRKRDEAVQTMSLFLWGYTANEISPMCSVMA